MSSLIDFENLSSQGDDMQMLAELQVVKDQRPKTEEDTRKEMLLEVFYPVINSLWYLAHMLQKAETLRTRLQLALYKIQTNQISMPFSRMTVPKTTKSSSPEVPGPSSSSPRSSSTLRPSSSVQWPTTTTPLLTPESTVAIARARATMDPKPTIKPLSSFPIPTIEPTAFSARWNTGNQQDRQDSQDARVPHIIPSSPPMSEQAEDGDDLEIVDGGLNIRTGNRTENQDRVHIEVEPRTPVHLSSPTGSVGGSHQRRGSESESLQNSNSNSQLRLRGLTSSVIKGEAANSLLQLVRGGGVATSSGVGMCGL